MTNLKNEADLTSLLEDKSKKKLILKYSPICGISHSAEVAFDKWAAKHNPENFILAKIDVIFSRELSREVASIFNIKHESPQVILLDEENNPVENMSHYDINHSSLDALLK